MKKEFEVSDEVWLKVVQLVQLAILTGIDVVDYLRQVRVTEGHDGSLVIADGYHSVFERTVDDLLKTLSTIESEEPSMNPDFVEYAALPDKNNDKDMN